MRDWMGKPLLLLAVIIVVLGAISAYWLHQGPRPAGADDEPGARATQHQQRIMQAMRQAEKSM